MSAAAAVFAESGHKREESDEFAAQTSRLPFAAVLAGRTRFEISEFRAWQIALAVVLFAGVFWLHGIIGPSPLWALQI
jgi:uncharacterized membrane protein